MGRETGISWTDHTFNPWWGCTRVSPGCDNCYAETLDRRMFPVQKLVTIGGLPQVQVTVAAHWGPGAPRREFGEKHWQEPLQWEKLAIRAGAAPGTGKQRRVFCASMADVMDDEAPEGARERLWQLVDATPHLTWQLLTKRPQRLLRYLPRRFAHRNVEIGVTAEDQRYYDLRWGTMLAQLDARGRADIRNRWVSYEPALGPLLISGTQVPDWVIFGGETGPETLRRPCAVEWAEALLEECRAFGVAFFMKQMSGRTPLLAKNLIPPHLMVQEFPLG